MATNYAGESAIINFVNDSTPRVSGTPFAFGSGLLGVPLADIAASATGAVAIEGVFEIAKVDAAVIAQGETVLWDESVDKVDDNLAAPATGDFLCGIAVEGKGTTSGATIKVKINAPGSTVT